MNSDRISRLRPLIAVLLAIRGCNDGQSDARCYTWCIGNAQHGKELIRATGAAPAT